MTRIEHFNNPDAPAANNLVPAASAVVTNADGAVLMMKRTDNGLWSIPGGGMEPGETIRETAIREVREETGFEVEPEFLIGIYSDPNHVVEFSDGEVRQQFSVCFACKIVGGWMETSEESSAVVFSRPREIAQLDMHESIRLRIDDFFTYDGQPHVR